MVSDRLIGAAIFVVALIVVIVYLLGLVIIPLFPDAIPALKWVGEDFWQLWLIRIPIIAAIFILGAIAMWIGWTILTTPPPKPIEEIEKELEEAAKEAEKQPPPPPPEKK